MDTSLTKSTVCSLKIIHPDQYQPVAAMLFIELSARIRSVVPSARIEHIGSSAIVGAVSKGDLDIFVGVEAVNFDEAIGALQTLGFRVKEGSLRTDSLCPFEAAPESPYPLDVGVQLVRSGSEFEFFLHFRDRLNSDPRLRDAYNQLKLDAALLSLDEYRKIKAAFIEKTLLA
jgi:GrpB-like predicted nucleotidyltransferase (UPF0157 family)